VNCRRVPAQLWSVYADNGDPLLLYGTDGEWLMLWPTPFIERHPIAFGRWCRRSVGEMRGKRVLIAHELCEKTKRWAAWLGVSLEQGIV
jgi:hypothetical protein